MTTEAQLLHTLGLLRRHRQRRLLLESAVRIALATLGAVIVALLVFAIAGPGTATVVSVRLIGYVVIGAVAVRFAVLPLLRRASDERMALYVEERAPELRQSLLAAVHELGRPSEQRASAGLTGLVVQRALGAVRPLAGGSLERPAALRALKTLGAVAVAAVLALTFGPPALRDAARVLLIPWSTAAAAAPAFAIALEPGDATVPRGGAVDVRASLVAFTAAGAELVFRPDSAAEWIRLPMVPDSGGSGFTSRLYDLVRPTEYYVEAENVRSRVYRLAVSDLPAARRIALELRFPAYTGLPPERIEDGGDVAALVGTTVTTRIVASKTVQGGALRFDAGPTVELTSTGDSTLRGSFRVSANGFYRVDLVAADGRTVPGTVQYAVEALPDRPPAVSFSEPGRDIKVTSVEEVALGIRSSDDYGVLKLELRYSVNGGEQRTVVLADGAAPGARELPAGQTLFLEEMALAPGDVIAYHAAARDGAGTWGLSDVYFLEVRPYSRDYRQAEQGGGGGGGESPDGFVVRQRQIVAATFNSLRDSAATDEGRRREDLTTVAIAQGRLRGDVATLIRRLGERGVAAADTAFHQIKAALDSAGAEMKPAEELLGRRLAREALPVEQRALRYLQRAEALYRDVQVQLGEQEGGGGGAQPNAEDLADLFELETDKLRNQYESVRRESERSSERELDETLERLRQLASRQQQENERMQRMAQELQERVGRSPSSGAGGGGSSAQRELARQAEEEARRLERLSRERNDPQLADAARRLQETAEAMKRAASGQTAQGNAALEDLRRATRDLESGRANRLSADIRDLENRAREMQERQREMASDVAGLQGATPEAREEQLRRLGERKDALAADVERLEADAERLSRGARRDQPGAAGALSDAAEEIRVSRLRDKIVFSKNVMRGGSSEYAGAFEGQIGEDLKRVAERLEAAAGALTGEPAGQRRGRALEGTRELVRGLESIRDRIAQRSSGDTGQARGSEPGKPGETGESGQPGQQGQEGQQGQQGQPGQQGQGEGAQEGQAPQGQQGREGQPNRLGSGDARQFGREFRMRREAAQELRRDLAPEGMDLTQLDRVIDDLRRLESARTLGDPKGLERLQAEAIERLKTFEFGLYRRLGLEGEHRPTAGTPAQVPPEYRALVEEYYRSLGRREGSP